MANEPDIKLLFGVEGGASIDQGSGKQIFDDLKKIVESINGKDVLKVKVGLDDGSAKNLKDQIKGIMSGVDAGAEVKVTGLDKTTKALEGVASAARKVGQAAKESSGDALAKGTKEYHDALTKINTLLIQLRNNQRNWSAASGGKSSADMAEIGAQIAALQSLEGKLAKGELTAEDFADEMSRVRSLATDAAESINALGESHKAVRILAEDTRAYNEALSRSYSLLAQIYTNQNSWTAAANGTSSSSYESFATAANDVTDLIASLRTGSVSADEFGDKYSEINARVKEASAVIKEAAENHAVESVHVERLTSGTQRYNDALARSYSLLAQIATNQNSWTAAIGGKSDASYQSFSTSADELNDLITALRSGGMAADDFADRYSLINASVKEASAAIRIAGENHDKVAILARDTQEYNDALSKTYSLLGQVSSNYASWTAASSGSSSAAYQSLGASISDIDDLISSVKEGTISAKDFAEEYSRINVAVKESSVEIKRAGENHAKEVSNLTRGTKEYYSALTRINTLLVKLSKNRERWSAASEGDGKSSIESIIDQERALKSLELRLYSGSISAEDFGREFSRIESIISYATERIRSIGEDHSAIEVLTKDTKEYNDALTKSYTLLGQVATHLKSWSASKTGESAPSYMSLSKSYSDLEMLTSLLEEGVVDANTFALTFADIKRNVAEASTAIKVAGENMKAVDSPDVIERLARVNAELKEITVQNSTLTSQYKKITGDGPIDGVSASSVDALKVKYQEMLRQTELLKVNRKTATDADIAGIRQLQDEVRRLVFDINKQTEAVKKTSSVDKAEKKEQMASLREVIALYEQIDKYLLKNSRAEGTAQYESLRKIRDELYSVKQAGEAAEGGLAGLSKAELRSKVGEVRSLESGLRDAGREGNTLAKSIAAAYQKFGGWMLVTQSLARIVGSLRDMVENVKQIDSAMTELKKVTSETDAVYDAFLTRAQEKASKLGVTVADTVTAAADFARLGHGIEDASALADAALVYKNVGDGIDDISTASQSIISTMQAFGYEADQAMLIVDKFNQVGNRYAVSSQGLGEILVRSAAAMASANNTLDETIALGTAANTILQNPEAVGTTMKTLSMYLRAAKTEAEEAGESTEGMAGSVSELRGEILSLTGGAVDIQINEDSFKSSYQILKELSQVWDQLTDVSQANILEMIGGKRNANAVAAILENFDIAENVLKDSANAAGSALAENEKYLDSIAGKSAQFRAAFESLSVEVIDSDGVKLIIDAGTALVNLVTQLQKMGALVPAVAGIVSVFTGLKKSMEIGDLAGKIASSAEALEDNADAAQSLQQTIAALSGRNRKLLIDQINQRLASEGIDEAQRQQIISTLALDKAQDKLSVSAGNVGTGFMNMIRSIPKWQIAIMGITTVISVISAVKNHLEQVRQEAIDSANEISTAFDEADVSCSRNIESLESLRDRYEKLAVSVGENGENVGLTASEYDEYLGIVKQISDISPQIIQGYDNEGRAILNYKSAIDDAVAAQEALLSTQKQTFLSGGRELFSGKKLEYGDVVKDLNSTLSVLDKYSSQATALANDYTLGNVDSNIAQAETKANAVNIALQKINVSFGDTTAEMIAGARQLSENSHQFINLLRESGSFSNSELTDLQSDLYGLADQLESIGEITTSLSDYVWVWGESNNWFSEDLLNNAGAVVVLRDALQSLMDPNLSNTTNLDNAKTLVDSFNEMVGSGAVQDIVAMSDGLANGTTSIEAYNAAVANWWGSASGDPAAISAVLEYLTGLSNKYVDVSASADTAVESAKSFSDVFTEDTTEALDGVQSSVSALRSALDKLNSGELGAGDVVDLMQQFPELAPYVDLAAENFGNLADGLKELIASAPEELINSLQELKESGAFTEDQAAQIDKLCDALRLASSEAEAFGVASSNIERLSNTFTEVTNTFSKLAELQQEVSDGFTMSAEKAIEFAKVYPDILNGATVAADGQLSLNEDVVNAIIAGKKAEATASIDAMILDLEGQKEALEAKKAFSEAQLELAKSVGEGEGQISHDVLMYRVQSGTAAVQALIDAGFQEADAYRLAAEAMSGNIQEFNSIAAEVCTDSQGNFNQAAYNMAQAVYLNMNRAKQDVASYTSQVHEAAKATNAMQSGMIAGSTTVKAGSKGGVWLNARNAGITSGSFNGTSAPKVNVEFELRDFITQLELDISEYESAISQIDGQIAVLKALRDKDLGSFKADKTTGSSGGGSKGSGSGSDAEKVSDALEDAEKALRDAFSDYLNDMEHYISLLERNNNPESSIIDAYKRMMDAVHEEAERARTNGEDEHSDYIQELQDQWWAYHDEIEKIRDDITENAKSAVDELVDYRIDMLKQQLEEEKDALDAQLDELEEFYDKQKDMLREQYDEKKYLEEQSEKRKAVSDIEAELESLRYDDSAWAQKRRAELEAELADARKELKDFEKENALDEVEKLLDEQYEKQAALVQDQIDAIEEKLNDPEVLFNQALADIRNSTEALYQEMVEYNAKHGDGNEETIRTFWEECFAALKDYEDLFGEAYNGVNMDNATGYEDQVGQVPTQGGGSTSSGSQITPAPTPSTPSTPSTPEPPSLEKGSYVHVKDGVKWYETSDGTGSWGRAKSGKIKYISKSGTHRYNIDGAGWVRKQDIVGYASGTPHATAGIHEFGENGDEVIFTSADGSKYRIFSDGEKVLNAKATNFLYDFANTFGGRNHAWDSLIGGILGQVNNIGSRDTTVEIHAGDIIVQGNADERTVSDIRRIKREQMNYILKEIGKLNK